MARKPKKDKKDGQQGGQQQGKDKEKDKQKQKQEEAEKRKKKLQQEIEELKANTLVTPKTGEDLEDKHFNYLKAKNVVKKFEEDIRSGNINPEDFESRRSEYARYIKDLREYQKIGGPISDTKLTYTDSINTDYFQNIRDLTEADTNNIFDSAIRNIKQNKEEIYRDAMYLGDLSEKIQTNIESVYNKMKYDMSSNLDNLDSALKEARNLQRSAMSASIVNDDMTKLLKKIIGECGTKVQKGTRDNNELRRQVGMKVLPLHSTNGRLCVGTPFQKVIDIKVKSGFWPFSKDEYQKRVIMVCNVAPHPDETGNIITNKDEEVDFRTYQKWKNIFDQVVKGRLRILKASDLAGAGGDVFNGSILNIVPDKGANANKDEYTVINLVDQGNNPFKNNNRLPISVKLPSHLPVQIQENKQNQGAGAGNIAVASFQISSLANFEEIVGQYVNQFLPEERKGYAYIEIFDDQLYFNNYSIEPEAIKNTSDPFYRRVMEENKYQHYYPSSREMRGLLDKQNDSKGNKAKNDDDDDDGSGGGAGAAPAGPAGGGAGVAPAGPAGGGAGAAPAGRGRGRGGGAPGGGGAPAGRGGGAPGGI